jgi:hypothetical protein
MFKSWRTILSTAAALALAGCAVTPSVQKQWTDPGYVGGPLKKVLVLAAGEGPEQRLVYEQATVAALRGQGTEAISAREQSPPIALAQYAAPIQLDKMRDTVLATGANSLMVLRLNPAAGRTAVQIVLWNVQTMQMVWSASIAPEFSTEQATPEAAARALTDALRARGLVGSG